MVDVVDVVTKTGTCSKQYVNEQFLVVASVTSNDISGVGHR